MSAKPKITVDVERDEIAVGGLGVFDVDPDRGLIVPRDFPSAGLPESLTDRVFGAAERAWPDVDPGEWTIAESEQEWLDRCLAEQEAAEAERERNLDPDEVAARR